MEGVQVGSIRTRGVEVGWMEAGEAVAVAMNGVEGAQDARIKASKKHAQQDFFMHHS
jgi:hypothetical protein